MQILEEARSSLESTAEAADIVAGLASELRELKRRQVPDDWEATIDQCRRHPLCALLHEDPLTGRAFTKPRNYQGDAGRLDMIYQQHWRGVWDKEVTALGEAIFEYTIKCKAPSAVRMRRNHLASMIDETCDRVVKPHILSVACGHLREAHGSTALRSGRVGRFVGLDQDPLSLAVVQRELSGYGVERVLGSIRLLLENPLAAQSFNFIYAAGLYDYLEDGFARRLTEGLFKMLRPGGRLLLCNYLPDIVDVGYMEAFMGWRLIYRGAERMVALAAGIPGGVLTAKRAYLDESDTIVFLQLDRST